MRAGGKISRRGLLGAAAAVGAAGAMSGALPARAARSRLSAARPAGQLPPRGEFVIRNAYVLTMDPALGDLERGDVHVRDGAIVAVGADLAAPGAETIDGRAMIALPGLIETHWHMWGAVARNMAGEEPDTGYFPWSRVLGATFTPEDNYRGVRLALAEALYSGITTVHNWSHNLLSPAYADIELRAHREIGGRARFAYGYSRNTGPNEALPLDDVARVHREYFSGPSDGLLTLGIATRGPENNTIDICRQEWDAARALGIPITTHVGITPDRTYGVQALGAAGLLGPDVQLVHATNNDYADFELIAATGTHVSLSPYTELRTGFGITPIEDMLRAGVPVSLSIDTTLLCGNADMFAVMKAMQNIADGSAQSEFAITPRRVLEMATIDGARDLGIADRVGTLTPGKRADVLLVRTTDVNMAPLTEPVRMIVQAAQPHNVDTVIVDGRILKRGGQLTALDVEQVVREAQETIDRVRAQVGA
ncbi:MAG TPA: amidohydrolase family protein [Chloroflexota bacterium]|nr:amidohydrolase family protein [Chloroflexota bacterium]